MCSLHVPAGFACPVPLWVSSHRPALALELSGPVLLHSPAGIRAALCGFVLMLYEENTTPCVSSH